MNKTLFVAVVVFWAGIIFGVLRERDVDWPAAFWLWAAVAFTAYVLLRPWLG